MTARLLTPPNIVAAGPTLTAGTAASCVPTGAIFSCRAGDWYVGRKLEVYLSGKFSNAITTPGTAKFTIKVGSVVACDLGAMVLDTVAHSDKPFELRVLLVCTAVGAGTTTKLRGSGTFVSESVAGSTANPSASGVAMLPWDTAPVEGTGFSAVADANFDVFFTETEATASLTVTDYYVREL